MELVDVVCLTIFTGEDVLLNDKPFYKTIAEKAKELELAGVTVTPAKAGFAKTRRGTVNKRTHFFSGVDNSPLIIDIVDKKENIEKILPFLEANAAHSCVFLHPCQILVTDYLREKFGNQEP